MCQEKLLEFESTQGAVWKMVFVGLEVETSRRKNGRVIGNNPGEIITGAMDEKVPRIH